MNLNRIQVYLIGIGIILSIILFNRILFIIKSDITVGEITNHLVWNDRSTYHPGANCAAIVNFKTGEYKVTFLAENNVNYDVGEKVKVIYNRSNICNARIYSFTGFWLPPIFYALFPFMLLSAAVFSFIDEREITEINLKKMDIFYKLFKKRLN